MAKILLVEDDPSIIQLYSFKLSSAGYEVRTAQNGLIGLKTLPDFFPDLILLDLRMPVMDGEAFLQAFRKKPEHADVPVIVLTNISRDEAPKTLWHYGISGYYVKANHTPAELVTIIGEVLA